MIKFFRHIRQRMIKENRVSRYLLYAIGEIVLVVIGILIALQINNWNEQRKLRVTERILLTELKSNIEATLVLFTDDTTFNARTIVHMRRIQEYVEQDLPYASELDTSFGKLGFWASPYPILTGYQTLQTKGIDIISNVPLRTSVINLYENEYLLLFKDYDRYEWELAQSMVHPFHAKHIRRISTGRGTARPNDYENLKKNDEFGNILSVLINARHGGIRSYEKAMRLMHEVLEGIDEELGFSVIES